MSPSPAATPTGANVVALTAGTAVTLKDENEAWRIFRELGDNRTRARKMYSEIFGRAFDDPSILDDLHKALREYDDNPDRVSVPIEI